ncbi:MAG: hypothetical protein OXF05_01555 [Hyphomicrobiales bacterium]|nr:hypothetical protein [Hyphomicrobiales bacterium]MCY4033412.1 hypothetical protein [Hyphomicrobiales bacterium]MCY4038561.1 hypothetical protein [Hyphomicrobiales bacterium]
MKIIKQTIRNLIKESVKEAIREETTSNFYAFWALANSQNVDGEDLMRVVRKNKRALESEGKKFSAGSRPFLTEEMSDKS